MENQLDIELWVSFHVAGKNDLLIVYEALGSYLLRKAYNLHYFECYDKSARYRQVLNR